MAAAFGFAAGFFALAAGFLAALAFGLATPSASVAASGFGFFSGFGRAALVGLAPFPHDSGKLRGVRLIRGGRKFVRDALYMPTLVATRHDPSIAAYYRRLVLRGKPKKLALIACMRKLLTILNAVFKTGRPYRAPDLLAS